MAKQNSGLYINPSTFKNFNEMKTDRLSSEIATRAVVEGNIVGWLNEFPDPDPILRKLGQDVRVYKDLLVDDEVESAVQRRKMGVKSLDLKIVKGKRGTDKEVAFCEDVFEYLEFNDSSTKDLIDDSLDPILWGTSVFEITYDIGKNWIPKKVEQKPIEWFFFDNNNYLRMRLNGSTDSIAITGPEADPFMRYKFIILRNGKKYDNPYGNRALSRCFWPVTFKRGGWRFFSMFIQKYGMPHVTGKQPRGSGDVEAADFMAKLSRMVMDAIAVIPDDSSVEIHQTGEKSSADIYKMYIDQCNASIQKAILTNTLSTDHAAKGGYSTSKTGIEIEWGIALQDKTFPEELFTKLCRYIIDLNFGNGHYVDAGLFEEEDINKDLAERDEKLSTQIKFTKKYFQRAYNLEEDDFDVVENKEANNLTQPFSTNPEFAAPVDTNKAPKENFTDTELQKQIDPVLDKVFEFAASVDNYDDFSKGLAKLYPNMNTKNFEEFATKLFFIAEITGRLDAQN